ncbi:PDZ domain-containing protein [Kaarinaea lacus]
MKTQIPLMIFIAGVGVIIGLLLQRPGNDTSHDSSTTPNSNRQVSTSPPSASQPEPVATSQMAEIKDEIYELTALRELVQKEVQARKELQTQLSEVTARLESLESYQNSETADTQQTSGSTIIRTTNNRQGINRPGWINAQALLDAGLDEFQANKIRQVYEDVEMQRLYLRDQAIREGWIGDERYRQEREKLDARLESLRDELSEKEYDAYLFATGRPNRVMIQSTLSTSPARDAGIKTGDNVIRYNNIRIYTWADLRNATTQCTTDSMVEVELERNGQQHRVFVPCGPLGVRLDNTSVQP